MADISGMIPRFWWTNRMPSAAAEAADPKVSGLPFTFTAAPVSGVWNPDRTLMSVDFPEPFSPSSPWTSPRATSIDTSTSAR